MTNREIEEEMKYRISERIGILAEDRPPTLSQRIMARNEAMEWRAKWLRENILQPELL